MAAGRENRADSWHCREELALRLAGILNWKHCGSDLGIHCSVAPTLEEELQQQQHQHAYIIYN